MIWVISLCMSVCLPLSSWVREKRTHCPPPKKNCLLYPNFTNTLNNLWNGTGTTAFKNICAEHSPISPIHYCWMNRHIPVSATAAGLQCLAGSPAFAKLVGNIDEFHIRLKPPGPDAPCVF